MERSKTPDSQVDAPDEATEAHPTQSLDFIRTIVAEDLRSGRHGSIVTRFPPEPNGYLHLGHAASIALNFGIAEETGGRCHLRFDDTNPETEETKYVDAIVDAVRWLGYDWGEHLYFASDYFEQMYGFAEHLIREGKAFVDSSSEEEIRAARGTVTEPGRDSPWRDRSVEENLDLFRRMRAGEFPNGAHVLRARIDMASPHMIMRDPLLYRIRHASHYRTGDAWCIYPMYDFAHPIEDVIECVTHSIATLEFENNRALYDWVVENIPGDCRPRQYEFARRTVDYTVMSKRKLLQLVRDGHVAGWDDPRLPTLLGLRRRGVTPEAIRNFAQMIGVARSESRVDIGKLEYAIRDDLNHKVPRVLCVLDPLRVVITNFAEGETERLQAPSFPHDVPREGSRELPLTREILIDRDDFMEDPPRGFHRLSPGGEVRLRYGYVIRCDEVVKDEAGRVTELRCSYDPDTRSGSGSEGRTVRGTIHWVSAEHGVPCEVRLYDRLFSVADPDAEEGDFPEYLNPKSLVVVRDAVVEPSVADDEPGSRYQFERLGYFCSDPVDSRPGHLVFNRTVTLRDTWARAAQGASPPTPPPAKPPTAATRSAGAPAPRRSTAAADAPRSPELEARRVRFEAERGLSAEEAEILTRDAAVADLFEAVVSDGRASIRGAANWLIHELPREQGERPVSALPFGATQLADLVAMVEDGTLSSTAGREVLGELARSGGEPREIVERRGLRQVSDAAALVPAVEQVLSSNAAKVQEYRDGKTGLLGFFIGQVMRQTGGKANPETVRELIARRLDG